MTLSKKQKILFIVSTAIIGALVYFANTAEILTAIQKTNPVFFSLAVLAGFMQLTLWTLNWNKMLESTGSLVSLKETFRLMLSSHFFNSITPLAQFGGEPIAAKLVVDKTELSYHEALSTVFSIDLINNLSPPLFLIGGFLYTFYFKGVGGESLIEGVYIGLAIVMLGVILGYLLWFENSILANFLIKLNRKTVEKSRRLKKYGQTVEDKIIEANQTLSRIGDSPRRIFILFLIGQASFIVEIFCMYFVLLALGINPSISILYIVLPLAGLADFSPTPGGLGTYEAAMTSLLVFLAGTSASLAVTATILFRLATYWQGLLLGYIAINS